MSVEGRVAPVAHALARFGCVSVGSVYVLIGVWAMLALLKLADPAADEQRILQRLLQFPLGGVFIATIALGTIGYILWLAYEAAFDPYRFGNTWKGIGERIGIGLSTLAYGVIVVAALKVLSGRGENGERQQQLLAGEVLGWPGGQWLVAAAGLVVGVAGLLQLKYVYDGEHKRRIQLEGRSRSLRFTVDLLGWAGYAARCAILLVIGGFLLKAAWSFEPEAVADTDTAFDFFGLGGGTLGDAVFSLVALGTIAYGLLMFVNAAYFYFGHQSANAPSGPRERQR